MNSDFVTLTYDGTIATVTISNPPMNPLSKGAISGLIDAFDELDAQADIRAVIITGAGEKAFVAGADIKEFPTWTPQLAEELGSKGQRLFTRIENFPAPVIAAVNGFALGGGLELALACDIRLCSENARMGLPEVGLGIIPGYGGTQRLAQTVPVGEAKKMIYTAEHIKPDKALAIGLVQEVTTLEALLPRAKELAQKIAGNAPMAVRAAKYSVNFVRNFTLEQGMAVELAASKACFMSEDKVEGVDAFINKRQAEFKNK